MANTTFIAPVHCGSAHKSFFASNFLSSKSTRRSRVPCVTWDVQPPRRPLLCSAQEQETKDAEASPLDNGSSLNNSSDVARQAKFDAQKLELMAERARLESERAQLMAERKRLELDKYKALRDQNNPSRQKETSFVGPLSSASPQATDKEAEKKPAEHTIPERDMSDADRKMLSQSPFRISVSDLMGNFPRIDDKDIKIIKENVCGMKTFFATDIERSPLSERVVFRGNLRLDPETAIEELEKLAEENGLKNRVRLFLLMDPKENEDTNGKQKPVLVALPAAATPNQTNFLSTSLALLALAVTVGTTFTYGIGIFGFTPAFIDQIAKGNLDDLYYTVPVALGVLAIAAAHDIGHRLMAKIRGIKLGLPYFVPSLQVGTFGTITPLESYPPRRKDLFDVAAAGPLVGMACSIGALVAGLSITGSGAVADWFPQVPSALFHASILVGTIADILLPQALREQATLAVHPLTVVGYTGILVNALNLLPIGRLDGGRIVQALYGRISAARISAIALILQGLSSIFGNSPLLLFWGLFCVFLQRESDYPCRNEIVEPDDFRTAIGLGSLFLTLAILIPFPDQLGNILGRY